MYKRQGQERPYAEKCALLEVLNVELAAQGEVLQQRRRDYLALLGPLACANYQELSHGAERMSCLLYTSLVCFMPVFKQF